MFGSLIIFSLIIIHTPLLYIHHLYCGIGLQSLEIGIIITLLLFMDLCIGIWQLPTTIIAIDTALLNRKPKKQQ